MNEKLKKPFYKRWWFIALVVFVIIGAFGGDDTDEREDKGKTVATVDIEDKETQKNNKANMEVTGDLSIEFQDDKVIAIIETNAMDGAIFETSLIDGNFNLVSDFISIENGKGVKEFKIPEEWDVGYISGITMMRFNLDEHPQPDHVKEIYGESGENLKGEYAEENNVNGYNINLPTITIPYPNEETVKEVQNELFADAMEELISLSNGIIVNMQPHFNDGDWSSVAVTVSDAWYNSPEHEKERFAETMGDAVTTIIKNTGKVNADKNITVYFYDTYQKELASPKVLGGYKIKR